MEKKKKLLDIVREKIRFKYYSMNIEQSYVGQEGQSTFTSFLTSSLEMPIRI